MEVDRSEYQILSDSRSTEELCMEDVSDSYTDYDGAKQPDDHLRMSLLALLCCFPCGIIALCNSMKSSIAAFSCMMSLSPEMDIQLNEPLYQKALPENYRIRSLLAVLFCCPIGIVALWQSLKVNSLHTRGREEEAKRASLKAAAYSSWAFISALITGLIAISLFIAGVTFIICFGIDWDKR